MRESDHVLSRGLPGAEVEAGGPLRTHSLTRGRCRTNLSLHCTRLFTVKKIKIDKTNPCCFFCIRYIHYRCRCLLPKNLGFEHAHSAATKKYTPSAQRRGFFCLIWLVTGLKRRCRQMIIETSFARVSASSFIQLKGVFLLSKFKYTYS